MIDRKTARSVKAFSKDYGYDVYIDNNNNLIYLSTINYKYIISYNPITKIVSTEDFSGKGKNLYKILQRYYGLGTRLSKTTNLLLILGAFIILIGVISLLYNLDNSNIYYVLFGLGLFGVGIIIGAIGLLISLK